MLEESILQIEQTEARMAEERSAAVAAAQKKLSQARYKADTLLADAEDTLKAERAAAFSEAEAAAAQENDLRRKSVVRESEDLRSRAEQQMERAVRLILEKGV